MVKFDGKIGTLYQIVLDTLYVPLKHFEKNYGTIHLNLAAC